MVHQNSCLYFIGRVIWCLVLDTAVDDHMDYFISVNPYKPFFSMILLNPQGT